MGANLLVKHTVEGGHVRDVGWWVFGTGHNTVTSTTCFTLCGAPQCLTSARVSRYWTHWPDARVAATTFQ